MMRSSRRSFLSRLSCLFGACFGLSTQSFATSAKRSRVIRLGPLSNFPQGNHILKIERIVLKRSTKGVQAVSLTCTHQPCSLNVEKSGFSCPCHGSSFDSAGKVLTGPAKRDLPWYKLSLDEGGYLLVHFDELVGPDWHLLL